MSQSQKTYLQLLDEAKARGIEYLNEQQLRKRMYLALWDAETIRLFFKPQLLVNHSILVNGSALALPG